MLAILGILVIPLMAVRTFLPLITSRKRLPCRPVNRLDNNNTDNRRNNQADAENGKRAKAMLSQVPIDKTETAGQKFDHA